MTNNIAAKVAEVKARLAAQKAATNQPVQQSVPTTYTTATPAEQPKKLTKEELLARAKAIIANNKAKTAELPSEPTKPLTETPVVITPDVEGESHEVTTEAETDASKEVEVETGADVDGSGAGDTAG